MNGEPVTLLLGVTLWTRGECVGLKLYFLRADGTIHRFTHRK